MERQLVSIIIPCFNQARFLPDSLESVLAQSYVHWECLIINNGSSDDTEDVGLAYAAKDKRIRYFSHPAPGVSGARNLGLDEARGQFIQFLDADDIIKPTKLEVQLQEVARTEALVIVYCDYYYAPENDLNTSLPGLHLDPCFHTDNHLSDLIARWETKLSIPMHCFLLDARFFTKHMIRFDEGLQNHVDWDCWVQVFALEPRVFYLEAKLAVYRSHSQSMCRNMAKMRHGFLKAIAKQRKRFADDQVLLEVLRMKRLEIEWVYREYAPSYPVRRFFARVARSVLPESWIKQVRMRRERAREKRLRGPASSRPG